jgi:hypothetical protein
LEETFFKNTKIESFFQNKIFSQKKGFGIFVRKDKFMKKKES